MPTLRLNAATIGLVTGIAIATVMLSVPPQAGMEPNAWRVAAIGLLMVAWWVTEAVPIAVTALVPLVFFPIVNVGDISSTAAPYANPVIFLFLGGFIIARALQDSGLHRRMALFIITIVGSRPRHLVAGFMAATAFISMWVSNTATVVMIYPMALSVIERATPEGETEDLRFPLALLLGVAYAANIGGIGTLIGSPPNALLAGFMAESQGIRIGFAQWMLLGVPLVLVSSLPRISARRAGDTRAPFQKELAALGPMSRTEWLVGGITLLTAMAWMTSPLLARMGLVISDAGIAIAGSILMFVVATLLPSRDTLTWKSAETLPWAVLILFGGGLSLADAVSTSGLAAWIGHAASALATVPTVVLMLAVTGVVLLLTELTSNTATTAVFLPIVASIALGMNMEVLLLTVPVALAASCAFMMPIATPPNAIVFASGRMTIPQMARAGFWVNVTMLLLINAAMLLVGVRVLG